METRTPASLRLAAIFLATFVFWALPTANARANDYQSTVATWSSHEDVGQWLEDNFTFDKKRQKLIQKRLRNQGPQGLLVRNPETLFHDKKGYCADAAHFALDALNRINPEHNARWVFIMNGAGKTNHWVTGFTVNGKLYVMDYGAGQHWQPMLGIHGPYASLDEYADFLSSLHIKGFSAQTVKWRDMPGRVD